MSDLNVDEEKLYNYLLKKGIPTDQEEIQNKCSFADQQLAKSLNGLIAKHRVEIFNQGAKILFSAINENELATHKILSELPHDEGLVYQSVDKAGDNGIWMGTIKRETNIPPVRLKKALKALQGKRLIKSFKSFGSKSRLLYIRFDLQPNKKLFGGVFWDLSTNAYDIAFINTIKKFFSGKIKSKIHATLEELRDDYVTELRNTGMAQVDLELEDVEKIINILIYDGDVEPVVTSSATSLVYKPSYLSLPKINIIDIPCIRCPIAKNCSDSGDITPSKCVYMAKWLDF